MPAVRAPAWPARSARPTAEVAAEPCRSANLLAALLQQLLHLPARSGVQQLGQSLQIRRAGSPARRPHRAQAAAAGRRPCHAAMPRGLSAIATSGCRSRARLLPLRKGIRWIHPAGPRHVFHSCPIGGLHLSGRGLRNRSAMRVMSWFHPPRRGSQALLGLGRRPNCLTGAGRVGSSAPPPRSRGGFIARAAKEEGQRDGQVAGGAGGTYSWHLLGLLPWGRQVLGRKRPRPHLHATASNELLGLAAQLHPHASARS